mgnify:CR=1 FL=1
MFELLHVEEILATYSFAFSIKLRKSDIAHKHLHVRFQANYYEAKVSHKLRPYIPSSDATKKSVIFNLWTYKKKVAFDMLHVVNIPS